MTFCFKHFLFKHGDIHSQRWQIHKKLIFIYFIKTNISSKYYSFKYFLLLPRGSNKLSNIKKSKPTFFVSVHKLCNYFTIYHILSPTKRKKNIWKRTSIIIIIFIKIRLRVELNDFRSMINIRRLFCLMYFKYKI